MSWHCRSATGEWVIRLGWCLRLSALVAAAIAGAAAAVDRPYRVTEQREPCSRYDPERQPYFGDTHVHTAYSFDAASQGTRNTPRDAYRFAQGEAVGLQPFDAGGKPLRNVRLDRPLDFAAVTDHSEMLGEVRICGDMDLPGSDSDACWLYRTYPAQALMPFGIRYLSGRERLRFCGSDGRLCLDAAGSVWSDIRAAAEAAYDRTAACRFTSFIGYEWTASLAGAINLHRNVLFRNQRVPELPLSYVETPSAFDLWQGLRIQCLEGIEGCDVLTIPHNSNLSGPGLIFETARLTSIDDAGAPVDVEEARQRQRFEPLVEIMQHKGDSECLLGADTTDEACDFEKLPYDSFAGIAHLRMPTEAASAQRAAMVREALKRGLALEERIGVNPLKYGILASTDTHLGTPGLTREAGSMGHGGAGIASGTKLPPGLPDNIEFSPGGLAAVWAEENSRDAIFSALVRREVYGTSGPRLVVRLFGGWDYPDDLCERADFTERGYAGGVPMGGDLRRPAGAAPVLAVSALRDPGTAQAPGTPLQRIQIVKGWVERGETHEQVHNVAGGPNDASVDLATCEPRGAGAEQLCGVWRDQDFDPGQRAFYYARVLENPTCRWQQHLCRAAGVDCDRPETPPRGFEACCDARFPRTVQERAWTSPIWYAP